ncbi:hypothetical protein SFRURICE_016500 [Spodoptera frugiperda]|nr:hypothetical protein SFRURICE_016500 [Spodoptera frugiperda]
MKRARNETRGMHGSSSVRAEATLARRLQTRTYGGQSTLRDPRRPEYLSRRLEGEEVRSLTYPASFFASMTASQKEETSSQSRSLLQRHSRRRESRDDFQPQFTNTCFFRTFSIVTSEGLHQERQETSTSDLGAPQNLSLWAIASSPPLTPALGANIFKWQLSPL